MRGAEVFYADGNKRSRILAEAAYSGLRRAGYRPTVKSSIHYNGPQADFAVFYGLSMGLDRVMKEYPLSVYIDLGYWKRRLRSRYDGYHKVIVNGRHPTDYFQQKKHNHNRLKDLNLDIKPWRKNGNHILVAAMSDKAARAEGLAHTIWERDIINQIKRKTDIPILFRPKPNCMRTRAVQGTTYDKGVDLSVRLDSAHAVVCRQSNVAVDAIVAGVPVYCEKGVGVSLSMGSIDQIADPPMPSDEDRMQFLADVSWTQFTTHEIGIGLPFNHLREEGLLPS